MRGDCGTMLSPVKVIEGGWGIGEEMNEKKGWVVGRRSCYTRIGCCKRYKLGKKSAYREAVDREESQ